MTTIAWRSPMLAADTQVTCADGTKLRACKIEEMPDGARVAFAGDSELIAGVRRWMRKGMPPRGRPRIKGDADFDAIIVKADGSAWMFDQSLTLEPITMPFIAIGSGAGYAFGAMACGRTAAQAVKVAARFDVNTSCPVDSYTKARGDLV